MQVVIVLRVVERIIQRHHVNRGNSLTRTGMSASWQSFCLKLCSMVVRGREWTYPPYIGVGRWRPPPEVTTQMAQETHLQNDQKASHIDLQQSHLRWEDQHQWRYLLVARKYPLLQLLAITKEKSQIFQQRGREAGRINWEPTFTWHRVNGVGRGGGL